MIIYLFSQIQSFTHTQKEDINTHAHTSMQTQLWQRKLQKKNHKDKHFNSFAYPDTHTKTLNTCACVFQRYFATRSLEQSTLTADLLQKSIVSASKCLTLFYFENKLNEKEQKKGGETQKQLRLNKFKNNVIYSKTTLV